MLSASLLLVDLSRPKPHRRIKDTDALRRFRLEASECAICGTWRNLHVHHIIYRSQSGDDIAANLVAVCDFHHRQIHARNKPAWLSLKEYVRDERPDTMAYLRDKLGPRGDSYFDI